MQTPGLAATLFGIAQWHLRAHDTFERLFECLPPQTLPLTLAFGAGLLIGLYLLG